MPQCAWVACSTLVYMSRSASQAVKTTPLTVTQCADCLGVTNETVRRYIREGKLKAAKVTRQGLKTEWGVLEQELRTFSKVRGIAMDLAKLP